MTLRRGALSCEQHMVHPHAVYALYALYSFHSLFCFLSEGFVVGFEGALQMPFGA
jgi:hypothetical protein